MAKKPTISERRVATGQCRRCTKKRAADDAMFCRRHREEHRAATRKAVQKWYAKHHQHSWRVGGPRLMYPGKTEDMHIRVTPYAKRLVLALARDERTSISDASECMMRGYTKFRKEKKP